MSQRRPRAFSQAIRAKRKNRIQEASLMKGMLQHFADGPEQVRRLARLPSLERRGIGRKEGLEVMFSPGGGRLGVGFKERGSAG